MSAAYTLHFMSRFVEDLDQRVLNYYCWPARSNRKTVSLREKLKYLPTIERNCVRIMMRNDRREPKGTEWTLSKIR